MYEAVISSPAGDVRGQGVRAVLSVTFGDETNRITSWSADVSRGDATVRDIEPLDTIVISEVLGGQRVEFLSGVINTVNYVGDRARLRGAVLLDELRFTLLHGLRIGETGMSDGVFLEETNFGGSWRDIGTLIYDSPGYVNIVLKRTDIESATALYIGMPHPFYGVDISVTIGNSVTSDMQVQYWDGTEWENVTGLTGFAAVPLPVGTTEVRYDFPGDWVARVHRDQVLYYLRIYPQDIETLDLMRWDDIQILIDQPTTDDVTDLLAAVSGWSVDGAYNSGTTDGTRHEFQQESAFAGLMAIAERSGELFRQGAGRTIQWLGSAGVETGIVATSAGQATAVANDNPYACVITRLNSYERDATDAVSRIYPYGAGTGDARVTLADSTLALPYGVSIDRDDNYIVNTVRETSIGRREATMIARNVTAPRQAELGGEQAANELLRQALAELEARGVRETLVLELGGLPQRLRAGDIITIDYRDNFEGSPLTLVGDYTIAKITNRISANGERTATATLTSDGKRTKTDAELLAAKIRDIETASQHPQYISGRRVAGLTTGGGWRSS
jgi:hypothetical protein